MDMSFAVQALSARHMAENYKNFAPSVIEVPDFIDKRVAGMKLAAWGLSIDALTPEQQKYLESWAG